MRKSIRKRLLTIRDIASLDEISHKQKTKIKYTAEELLIDMDDKLHRVDDDSLPHVQKRLLLELSHIFQQIKEVVHVRSLMKPPEDFLMEEWCCLYSRYLDLIARIRENYSDYLVHKKHIPPFLEIRKWKNKEEEA